MKTMHDAYLKLLEDQEKQDHAKLLQLSSTSAAVIEAHPRPLFERRKPDSIFKRFKTVIMPVVNKFCGIYATESPPASGETEQDLLEKCKVLFKARNPSLPSIDNFIECWEYLKDRPKFANFANEETKRKAERPIGTKAAKKNKADKEELEEVIDKSVKKATSGSFMSPKLEEGLTQLIAMQSAKMQAENDKMLLASLDTPERKKMSAALLKNRIAQLNANAEELQGAKEAGPTRVGGRTRRPSARRQAADEASSEDSDSDSD